MIDLSVIFDALKQTGIVIIDIYRSLVFVVNGHEYNGFVVIVSLLIIMYLISWIWGGDDEDE